MGFHIQLFRPPTDPLRPINPNNACHLCITAAAGTELAVASSAGTVKALSYSPKACSPLLTGVYNPKAFILHAASRRQGFPHCERFSTAATRRCLDSVSVPVCRVMLSHPVGIVGLVSRYLTNYLIPRRPVLKRNHTFGCKMMPSRNVAGNYPQFPAAMPNFRVGYLRITHPCATHIAVRTTCMPNPRRQRSF